MGPLDDSYIWQDRDGDGLPQAGEIRFSRNSVGTYSLTVDQDMNYVYFNGLDEEVRIFRVTNFNSVGAPNYQAYPGSLSMVLVTKMG